MSGIVGMQSKASREQVFSDLYSGNRTGRSELNSSQAMAEVHMSSDFRLSSLPKFSYQKELAGPCLLGPSKVRAISSGSSSVQTLRARSMCQTTRSNNSVVQLSAALTST